MTGQERHAMTATRALGRSVVASAFVVTLGIAWAGDSGSGAASPDSPPSAPAAPTASSHVSHAPGAPADGDYPANLPPGASAPAGSMKPGPADATGNGSVEAAAGVAGSADSPALPTGGTDQAQAPGPSAPSTVDASTPSIDVPIDSVGHAAPAATPRPSLLPLAQPLWSELGDIERRVLEPFASQWNALPSSEKRAWADLARRFPKMKPEVQKRVQKRITEWAALTPQQRAVARENYRLAQQAPVQSVAAEWESYQTMTPEQRSVLVSAGSTPSNTAARNAAGPTGLARVAYQPLPRRTPPVIAGPGGAAAPAASPSQPGGTAASPLR